MDKEDTQNKKSTDTKETGKSYQTYGYYAAVGVSGAGALYTMFKTNAMESSIKSAVVLTQPSWIRAKPSFVYEIGRNHTAIVTFMVVLFGLALLSMNSGDWVGVALAIAALAAVVGVYRLAGTSAEDQILPQLGVPPTVHIPTAPEVAAARANTTAYVNGAPVAGTYTAAVGTSNASFEVTNANPPVTFIDMIWAEFDTQRMNLANEQKGSDLAQRVRSGLMLLGLAALITAVACVYSFYTIHTATGTPDMTDLSAMVRYVGLGLIAAFSALMALCWFSTSSKFSAVDTNSMF